ARPAGGGGCRDRVPGIGGRLVCLRHKPAGRRRPHHIQVLNRRAAREEGTCPKSTQVCTASTLPSASPSTPSGSFAVAGPACSAPPRSPPPFPSTSCPTSIPTASRRLL